MIELRTPFSLNQEHEELYARLAKATRAGGQTGNAAQALARILHPHFAKEEQYALPPLELLPELAAGRISSEMSRILVMTDKLENDLDEMLGEHRAAATALNHLVEAAKQEGKPEYEEFAEQLRLHVRTEEEILYPAAILVGKYLRLRLRRLVD